jgi:hypothetical protein
MISQNRLACRFRPGEMVIPSIEIRAPASKVESDCFIAGPLTTVALPNPRATKPLPCQGAHPTECPRPVPGSRRLPLSANR